MVPNYTCSQTFERSWRSPPSKRFEIRDRLRLEVALVDGEEMFAWPGANQFETSDIRALVEEGMVGTGDFALHAHSVFMSTVPNIAYAGRATLEGRELVRYEYRIPQMSSTYYIRAFSREVKVGYSGPFWVDPATLDVARLDVIAEDIPADLGLTDASTTIRYQRVRIGEANFLLPVSSDQSMNLTSGLGVRNRANFSGCRQFKGESAISFGEAATPAEATRASKAREIVLPTGLQMDLTLQTAIDWEQSYVGGPLTARVVRDIKNSGAVIVPKGAIVSGRIAGLKKLVSPFARFDLRLCFYSLEFDGKRAGFAGRLMNVGPMAGYTMLQTPGGQLGGTPRRRAFILNPLSDERPGCASFAITGDMLRLPSGLPMLWRTEDAPAR